MGLDITAVKLGEKVDDIDDGIRVFASQGFDYQFGDLEEGVYEYEPSDHHFSKSYGGWSVVRETLAELAGWEPWTEPVEGDDPWVTSDRRRFPRCARPMYDDNIQTYDDLPLLPLICFSDCEGTICTEVCEKIAADLAVLDLPDDLVPLRELFTWAADNKGVVIFH